MTGMRISWVVCFFGLAFGVMGQVKFSATASATTIVEGGTLEVYFKVENGEGRNLQVPQFEGFDVIGGPNRSSQMSIVNGRTSQSMSVSYSLLGKKVGKYTIGQASITINNKTYTSSPIPIEIVKGREIKRNQDGMPTNEDIFVQLVASDSVAYVGQQISLDYVLYTTKDIRSTDFLTESDYSGFFAIPLRNGSSTQTAVINGIQYATKTIKTVALFPQQKGKMNIDGANIRLGLPSNDTRSNGFFFTTREIPYNTSTNPVSIQVKSLPENAPVSFSGGVGKYRMQAQLDKKKITTDDAFTVHMTIWGDGDIKFLAPAKQPQNPAFDFYDPNLLQEQSQEVNGKVEIAKVYEYLIIPKQTGMQTIVPEFTYFDTDSSEYVTLRSPAFEIEVRQGSNKDKNAIVQKGEALTFQPNYTYYSKHPAKGGFMGTGLYWTLFCLPFIGIAALYLKKVQINNRPEVDLILLKQSMAAKLAAEKLAVAKDALDKDNLKLFYEKLNEGLYGYASDKILIPAAELTMTSIESGLAQKGIDSDSIRQYAEILSICQRSIYGGGNLTTSKDLYEKSLQLIQNIESQLA